MFTNNKHEFACGEASQLTPLTYKDPKDSPPEGGSNRPEASSVQAGQICSAQETTKTVFFLTSRKSEKTSPHLREKGENTLESFKKNGGGLRFLLTFLGRPGTPALLGPAAHPPIRASRAALARSCRRREPSQMPREAFHLG